MGSEDLIRRTKQFALRVIKLVDALPATLAGRKIGDQLIRAGTSVGANYRAACRGRSKAEFIAKIGTVEEEADESAYWMELIMEAGLLKAKLVTPVHGEAEALRRIMAKSRITASRSPAASKSPHSAFGNRQLAIGNAHH